MPSAKRFERADVELERERRLLPIAGIAARLAAELGAALTSD